MKNTAIYKMLIFMGYGEKDVKSVFKEMSGIEFVRSIASYYDRTWYLTKRQEEVLFRIVNESLMHNVFREMVYGIHESEEGE